MKIIHIITGLNTGGAERALYNLLQGGLNTEFDCYVVSLSDAGTMGSQIEAVGVPVITLDMPVGRPTLSGVLKLRRVIKELQPDLIQGWMYHGNLVATLARLFCSKKTPVVWNVRHSLYNLAHEKRMTRLVIRLNRFFSKFVASLLYNSQLSRSQHEAFGFASSKGQVIPNGINCQQFNFSEEARQRILSELLIPTDALVVGHVARFHPMKDHALFLEAAVDIAQRNSNIHFLLIGRGVDSGNASLKQQIPIELQNQFYLLGERSDVSDLMSSMDIFCQSSWSEAFPNVLGEAMAVGIPCVATDVGDSALIVGDCGVIVPPREVLVLAEAIVSLLDLSDEQRRKLGQKGRVRVKNNFALGTIVQRYSDLYKGLLGLGTSSEK